MLQVEECILEMAISNVLDDLCIDVENFEVVMDVGDALEKFAWLTECVPQSLDVIGCLVVKALSHVRRDVHVE